MARSLGEPCVGASGRLAHNKERILREWEDAVRREIAVAPNERLSLLDSVPELLDSLIVALDSAATPATAVKVFESMANELARGDEERSAQPAYTLDQMVWEYHLLDRVLFRVLDADEALSLRERELIRHGLFVAMRNASARFVTLRDQVTRSKHASKLAEAEQYHHLLLEAVQDYAIFTISPDGLITTWNPGCVHMKQYTADEVIGRPYEMLYPPEGRRRNEPGDHLRIALLEGHYRGEGVRQKKDGTQFLADVNIVPMFLEGVHVGFGKVVQNVDERKRLVQERDLSRSEAETLRVEQALRDAFVATLTHDLRTPLTAARMSAQLIARKPENVDNTRKLAGRIMANCERMDTMIRNLLDAGRIKAGEPIRVEIAECDLTEIAFRVCEDLITIHGDRFRVARSEAMVGHWSPDAMRRILENLLANAEKYGESGAPITVGLRESGDRVLLTVHNTGAVIAPEDRASMFDQFRRTRTAETGTRKGWGLGLTLVRGLAAAQGGTVKVESGPQEGTVFTIDLPRDATPFAAIPEPT